MVQIQHEFLQKSLSSSEFASVWKSIKSSFFILYPWFMRYQICYVFWFLEVYKLPILSREYGHFINQIWTHNCWYGLLLQIHRKKFVFVTVFIFNLPICLKYAWFSRVRLLLKVFCLHGTVAIFNGLCMYSLLSLPLNTLNKVFTIHPSSLILYNLPFKHVW